MRVLMLAVLLSFMATFPVGAQDSTEKLLHELVPDYAANNKGGIWKAYTHHEKVAYVTGFLTASYVAAGRIPDGPSRWEVQFPYSNETVEIYVQKLDAYYKKSENLNYPIGIAITLINGDKKKQLR